ncbi:hypothetical protein [Pseudomonas sp. 22 E 5]|nr:hypothetical protein [Pseudomonas sp. 22 E 5]
MGNVGFGQVLGLQRAATRAVDARIGRHAVEVLVSEQALGQRREGNHTGTQFIGGVQQVFFNPAVEQVVGWLVNQQRHFPLLQQSGHFAGFHPRIRRDTDVQRLALLHGSGECAGGFFQRGVGVKTVGVENIHVVDAQALQALVQARQNVFARTATLAVRAGPHVPAGFAGDDQLVAVVLEVFTQQTAEVDLGAAIRWAVVVGQVEVVDPQVECGAQQGALGVDRGAVAKVVPQPQGQCRQHQPTAAYAAVRDRFIAVFGSNVSHRILSWT